MRRGGVAACRLDICRFFGGQPSGMQLSAISKFPAALYGEAVDPCCAANFQEDETFKSYGFGAKGEMNVWGGLAGAGYKASRVNRKMAHAKWGEAFGEGLACEWGNWGWPYAPNNSLGLPFGLRILFAAQCEAQSRKFLLLSGGGSVSEQFFDPSRSFPVRQIP